MKVLMYGWEFPPRISGGLGTACYAIVQELAQRDIGLTLVLPYTLTNAGINNVNFIGCDHIDLNNNHQEELASKQNNLNIKYTQIAAHISPYMSTRDFKLFCISGTLGSFFDLIAQMDLPEGIKSMAIDAIEECSSEGQITGKYGVNLLLEVFRYAMVAGSLAKTTEHDVIYAHDW